MVPAFQSSVTHGGMSMTPRRGPVAVVTVTLAIIALCAIAGLAQAPSGNKKIDATVTDPQAAIKAASAAAEGQGVLHRGRGDRRARAGHRAGRRSRSPQRSLRLERVRDGRLAEPDPAEPAHVAHRRSARRTHSFIVGRGTEAASGPSGRGPAE